MLKNKRNGNILANNIGICKSIFSLAKGLMFSRRRDDFAMVLDFGREKKISLHMFFVFYPIDVVFLDEKKKVVEAKENFKPFTFYEGKSMARYAIEVVAGTVKKSGTKIGDKLEF